MWQIYEMKVVELTLGDLAEVAVNDGI